MLIMLLWITRCCVCILLYWPWLEGIDIGTTILDTHSRDTSAESKGNTFTYDMSVLVVYQHPPVPHPSLHSPHYLRTVPCQQLYYHTTVKKWFQHLRLEINEFLKSQTFLLLFFIVYKKISIRIIFFLILFFCF